MSVADDLLHRVRAALPDVLIATDFDGTLAPIVVDPQNSRPVAGAVEALVALAATGAHLAIVTGRDARTVLSLGGLDAVPGLTIAGLYGIETWHDGELTTPDTPPEIVTLRHRLPGLLAGHDADPELWIEDKRLSLVVHGRRAGDPDAALAPLIEPLARLADELGLEMHHGKEVLELRLPGYDKAGALRRLADGIATIVYLGDDLGDLSAYAEIAALREQGRTAFGVAVAGVAEVEAAADLVVDSPGAAVALLARLASG